MGKIADLPAFDRPREKLWDLGRDGLTDAELLAILLRTGYQGKSALDVAKRVLSGVGLSGIGSLEMEDLAKLKGVGKSRAASIVAGLELGKRIWEFDKKVKIESPADVARIAHFLVNRKKEHLLGIYLNARNQVVDSEVISVGTITASLVHPREVFAPAISLRAVSVVVAHNHPSDELDPSDDDVLVSYQLLKAGRILGIELQDHVIVGKSGYVSLRECGAVEF